MSRLALHNKLREEMVSGSLICTLQTAGKKCEIRHGPLVAKNRELGFAPCPTCLRMKAERAGMTQKETAYAKKKKRELEYNEVLG